ncbi:MAG: cadherin-like domain-containing protein [Verrucomicrobiota bacterium]
MTLSPPQLTQQPESLTVLPDTDVILSVVANGFPEVRYQWCLNGENIPGATGPSLLLFKAQPADSGAYSVTVWNELGAVNSATAFVSVDAPALPFSDTRSDAGSISNLAGVGRGSNVGAKREAGEPKHDGKKSGASIWICWTAPETGIATFNTDGSDFDTVLAVYTRGDHSIFNPVTSDDDSGGYHTSRVRFNAKKGARYDVAVSGPDKEVGNVVLGWTLLVTSAELPIIHSDPLSQTVNFGSEVSLSIDFSSTSPVDVQWTFNGADLLGATSPWLALGPIDENKVGLYEVRLTSNGDLLYSSPPAEIQVNTEGAPSAATNKKVDALEKALKNSKGAKSSGARATLNSRRLGLRHSTMVMGYSGTQLFNTAPGKDPNEPNHCGVMGGASYWFAYEAPESGVASLDTNGSSYDTLLAVYYDDGKNNGWASLIPVMCDNNSGSDGQDSALKFNAAAGTIYYVVIDGVNGAYGRVYLNYSINVNPTLTTFANLTTPEDTTTSPISFSIGDRETAPDQLHVSVGTSNSTLLPLSGITLGGSGANRTLTLKPALNKNGSVVITVTVRDAAGALTSRSFNWTVTSVNDPPVAGADYGFRYGDYSVTFYIPTLMKNDYDVDSDILSVTSVSNKSYGGCTVTRNGDYITYTPTRGMTSSDYFCYTISDGKGGLCSGKVTVTVYQSSAQ